MNHRKWNWKLGLGLILSLVILSCGISPVQAENGAQRAELSEQQQNGAYSLSYTIRLPEYRLILDQGGYDRIQIVDFGRDGAIGQPLLPVKSYHFALPPDARLDSIRLVIESVETELLPGPFHFRLSELPVSACCEGSPPAAPGFIEGAAEIAWLELGPPGQMRSWKIARVVFRPFQLDPETGNLFAAREINFRLEYDRLPNSPAAAPLPALWEEQAASLLTNYNEARDWYPDPPPVLPDTNKDLVVITTDEIVSSSKQLSNYLSHKQNQGYNTLVVTNSTYNLLTGPPPNDKADKIRQWLIENYQAYGIQYVLIIGNAEEGAYDNVHMKETWPRNNATVWTDTNERRAFTDYYFADLTGDWDYDNDQVYGEWDDDFWYAAGGGVDLYPEVIVGRIPIWSRQYDVLDSILEKIMAYESEGDISWRDSAFFAISQLSPSFDPTGLGEQMLDDFLDPLSYSSYTMYMQGSACEDADSPYTSDEELRGGTLVRDHWAPRDYGLVVWSGHGLYTSVQVGYTGCDDGNLLTSTDVSYLDDDHPAFVYQGSCITGYPGEYSLGHRLLANGAIATVSATQVAWGHPAEEYGDYSYSGTVEGIAYGYTKRLVWDEMPAGKALFTTKYIYANPDDYDLMNFYIYNLYGDPTVGIHTCPGVPPVPASAQSSQGDYADRIRTSWPETECADYYHVVRSTGTAQGPYTEVVGDTTNLYLDYPVDDEETHYFAVWACNNYGCSNGGKIATAGGYAYVPRIMINEVTVGTVDQIELYNFGAQDVNLDDFIITTYGTSTSLGFALPDYTLGAGEYVVVDERMKTGFLTHRIWMSTDIPWDLNEGGAVLLTDDDLYGLDFLRWGDSTIPATSGTSWSGSNPPAVPDNSMSLGRWPNAVDTDSGGNWCLQDHSLLADNTACLFEDPDNPGFYVPSGGKWYFKNDQNDGWSNFVTLKFAGASGVIPIVGDWDNDGLDTAGFYTPSSGKWYLKNDQVNGWGNVEPVRFEGPSEAIPVAGDWDHDGTDTIGFYHPSGGKWYLKNDLIDGWSNFLTVKFAGAPGSLPVVGDWNDDSRDTVGFYVPSDGKWYLKNDHNDGWNNYLTVKFAGASGALPVAGDWDADGADSIGFYDPVGGKWYLKNSVINGWRDFVTVKFAGPAGAISVAGDWQ